MCNIFAPNLLHRKLSQLQTQRSHPQGNGGQMHLMAFSRFLHFPRMNLNPAAVPAVHIFSAALTRFPVHASLFSPLFMFTFVHVHLYFSLSVSPSPMHMHKPLMALLQSLCGPLTQNHDELLNVHEDSNSCIWLTSKRPQRPSRNSNTKSPTPTLVNRAVWA